MKTILILVDSVNRRFLNCYGAQEAAITPNLDRLAARSTIFDNHYCGSSPCMPARRDIMTGRLNFLERPWGGIEAFDHTVQSILEDHGVFSCMITDHYHYLETGGENYLHHFSAWRMERGQENDLYYHHPGPSGFIPPKAAPAPRFTIPTPYAQSRSHFHDSGDFPTPRTFTDAAGWLEENREADDFLLWVEGFDPHEPFDVPRKYLDLYGDTYTGPELIWPRYTTTEQYTPEEVAHLRRRYKALLTMTDDYLGKLLDVLDRHSMWEDTQVIFTTDHGYMLGEHGYFAKNYMPDYNETYHIPLLFHRPGQRESARVSGLTQNIDLFPTLLETYGIPLSVCRNPIHGRSLFPLLRGETDRTRDAIIFGQFGKTVSMTDGKYTYFRRAVRPDNQPLNVYASMPSTLLQYYGYESIAPEDYSRITLGHLRWTPFPVYKIPADCIDWHNESQTFRERNAFVPDNMLFDNQADYAQERPIHDEALESRYAAMLRQLMEEHDAPDEQFERLGL